MTGSHFVHGIYSLVFEYANKDCVHFTIRAVLGFLVIVGREFFVWIVCVVCRCTSRSENAHQKHVMIERRLSGVVYVVEIVDKSCFAVRKKIAFVYKLGYSRCIPSQYVQYSVVNA